MAERRTGSVDLQALAQALNNVGRERGDPQLCEMGERLRSVANQEKQPVQGWRERSKAWLGQRGPWIALAFGILLFHTRLVPFTSGGEAWVMHRWTGEVTKVLASF